MKEIINELKNGVAVYLSTFDKIKTLDINATFRPFYNGQVTGIKIIFDCILTNSALKYIYDICENENLNLRLTTNTDNKFNLLIFKNIK